MTSLLEGAWCATQPRWADATPAEQADACVLSGCPARIDCLLDGVRFHADRPGWGRTENAVFGGLTTTQLRQLVKAARP